MSTLTIAIPQEFDIEAKRLKEELEITTSELRVKHFKGTEEEPGKFYDDATATVSALLKQWKHENKDHGSGMKAKLEKLQADSDCLQAIREIISDVYGSNLELGTSEEIGSVLHEIHSICTEGLSDAPTSDG